MVCYNHDAANSHIPAAWVGRVAPNYPASVTWKWKELYGIPATDEKGVDLQELLEGRCNIYLSNHGRAYMSEGICTDGDFIDTVISRWQIKESMRTKLVNLFVDTEHVCYDDQGFTMVAEQVIALNLTEWLNWKLREGATTTIERTASYEFEASGRPRHPEAGRERRIYRDHPQARGRHGGAGPEPDHAAHPLGGHPAGRRPRCKGHRRAHRVPDRLRKLIKEVSDYGIRS